MKVIIIASLEHERSALSPSARRRRPAKGKKNLLSSTATWLRTTQEGSTLPQTQGPSHHQKHRREIPDLLSWVQCFGTYIAVVTSKCPEQVRHLLAYLTLIVWEACRCGGRGWLAYDSYFSQQVVGDDSADWSKLNQSLYAVTFIAQGNRERGRSCAICLESDHTEEQCALYSSTSKSAAGRKEKPSSERGLEGKSHLVGGRSHQA